MKPEGRIKALPSGELASASETERVLFIIAKKCYNKIQFFIM